MINLKRFILEDLIKWKNSKYRKPLILKGARQIGKTYILNQFGKEYYEDINHLFIWHGRNICGSRKANCLDCPIKNFCEYYAKNV